MSSAFPTSQALHLHHLASRPWWETEEPVPRERERERERGGRRLKSGNMRIVYLAELVNDIKGWLLLIIIRDNSFFVLTSKLPSGKVIIATTIPIMRMDSAEMAC